MCTSGKINNNDNINNNNNKIIMMIIIVIIIIIIIIIDVIVAVGLLYSFHVHSIASIEPCLSDHIALYSELAFPIKTPLDWRTVAFHLGHKHYSCE